MFRKSFPNHYGKDDERECPHGCSSSVECSRQTAADRKGNAGARFFLTFVMFDQGCARGENRWEGEEKSTDVRPKLVRYPAGGKTGRPTE
jgi:hypothetical protein